MKEKEKIIVLTIKLCCRHSTAIQVALINNKNPSQWLTMSCKLRGAALFPGVLARIPCQVALAFWCFRALDFPVLSQETCKDLIATFASLLT